ncbi:hypothetical protein BH11PSE7_BH11PSE7_03710 [soil metagenome]
MYPKAHPAFTVSPNPYANPVVPSRQEPERRYGFGLTGLNSMREKIVSAAGLKGFGDIDAHAGEAIEFLINLATRADAMGTDAQKILRELYANPDCANIRDNLQKAAYNMCKIAHAAHGSSAPLSVTVACLGGAIAQGDVKHFLNAYLNNRLNNQPTVDVLGSNRDVRASDLEASGKTLKNFIVKGDPPITLCAHAASSAENLNTLQAIRKLAIEQHTPVIAMVNSDSPDFPHWIQVVIAPKDDGRGVEWYCLNSPVATSAGHEAQTQLMTLLDTVVDRSDTKPHAIGGFNDVPNTSGLLGDRFIRVVDAIAGQKDGQFEGWIGRALAAKRESWSVASPEDKQAALLASQAEILDAAAAATDADVAKGAAQAWSQAHANHSRPAAIFELPNGYPEPIGHRTPYVPEGVGSGPLRSSLLSEPGRPVSRTVQSNLARPRNEANDTSMASLRAKAQNLGIRNADARGASGVQSVLSDIVEFRKQTCIHLLTPHNAKGAIAKTAALKIEKGMSPEGRNFEQSFRSFGLPLHNTSQVDVFVVHTERHKYSSAQWAVSTARSKAADMALRPAEFLKGCGIVSASTESNLTRADELKSMADAFIMECEATAAAISKAINTANVPKKVRNELQKLQADCLNNPLYTDMIAFAQQIQTSPELGLAYFDSLRPPHAA